MGKPNENAGLSTTALLFKYFRSHWFRYVIGLALAFVSTWFTAIFPRLLGEAIDLLREGAAHDAINHAALLLALSAFGSLAFRFLWRYLVLGFTRGAETFIRRSFFAHLETLSADFYIKHNTGDVITRGVSDVTAIRRMFGGYLVRSLDAVITFLLAAMNMYSFSGGFMTFLALVPIPFLLVFIVKMRPVLRKRQSEIRVATSAMASKVQENLTGIRIVKAFAREDGERERFATLSTVKRKAELRRVRVGSLVAPVIQIVYSIVFAVFIVYGSQRMADGLMSLGDFTAFNGYILMMILPIASLGAAVGEWQTGMASIARIDEMLLYEPDVADSNGLAEAYERRVSADGNPFGANDLITFSNLTFAYPETDVEVLRDLTATVKRGEVVAITGPTGCGKSTLMSIFARLWALPRGMMSVGGVDVNDVPISTLRDAIGYVPQDNFLFSDSILENIRFFADGVTEEDVYSAARAVSVHDNIMEFAQTYETVVGERGLTLSGGQMQRVAIARALVRRPQILLLDDCLSAVDAETERAIIEGLRGYLNDSTALIVTHRVAAAALADRVLVLNAEGGVAEFGAYDELVAAGGAFASLVELQTNAAAEEGAK